MDDKIFLLEDFNFDPGVIVLGRSLSIAHHSYGCLLSDFIKKVEISSKVEIIFYRVVPLCPKRCEADVQ